MISTEFDIATELTSGLDPTELHQEIVTAAAVAGFRGVHAIGDKFYVNSDAALTSDELDDLATVFAAHDAEVAVSKRQKKRDVDLRTQALIKEKAAGAASWDAWQAAAKTCFDDGVTLKASVDAAADKEAVDAVEDTRA